ncbi:Cob(I)alamin adenosyltransferase [Klebsiella pneumoniae]|uniref:Cob(I)alamin adenosyltransferase n=1 Tax=Klebsiella pneumoniae TaxID=573 RepID=A0A377TRI0_KLEPN|nr:Cob(I)alamin adenosyltransferase [Klebsiella pneumoniae]
MSDERYRERQQRLKDKVDARVAAAQDERGIVMVFTGNGKGKTTAALWHRDPRRRPWQKSRRDPVYQGDLA